MKEIRDELIDISELLYQENIQPAYRKLTGVLPKMGAVIESVEDEDTRETIVEKLKLALEAMEAEDTILLADVIQYELVETIGQLL